MNFDFFIKIHYNMRLHHSQLKISTIPVAYKFITFLFLYVSVHKSKEDEQSTNTQNFTALTTE